MSDASENEDQTSVTQCQGVVQAPKPVTIYDQLENLLGKQRCLVVRTVMGIGEVPDEAREKLIDKGYELAFIALVPYSEGNRTTFVPLTIYAM
jgi:hypothetical protein